MTKQPDSDGLAGRDRPVQIEITPEMIEAGVEVLCAFDPEGGVSYGKLAAQIFGAMASRIPDSIEYGPCLIAEIMEFNREFVDLDGGEDLIAPFSAPANHG